MSTGSGFFNSFFQLSRYGLCCFHLPNLEKNTLIGISCGYTHLGFNCLPVGEWLGLGSARVLCYPWRCRLPSGKIWLNMSSLNLQFGRKHTDNHGWHKSRFCKLNFSESPRNMTVQQFFARRHWRRHFQLRSTFQVCRHFICIYELITNLLARQEGLGYFYDHRTVIKKNLQWKLKNLMMGNLFSRVVWYELLK